MRAINQRDLAGEWRTVTSGLVVTAPGAVTNVALGGEPARDADRQPTAVTATWSGGSTGLVPTALTPLSFFVDNRRTDRQENVSGTSATSSAGMPRFGFVNRSATLRVVVTATNGAGSGVSGAADRVITRASQPGDVNAGFGISVSDGGSAITGSWDAPTDTGGQNIAITGYKVQVQIDGGTWRDFQQTSTSRLDAAPLSPRSKSRESRQDSREGA